MFGFEPHCSVCGSAVGCFQQRGKKSRVEERQEES